jgi:HEAT repeat protein
VTRPGRKIAGLGAGIVLAAAVLVVCRAGEGPASQAEAAVARVPSDSLAAALLATVRGADPVVCELAVRAVDGRHGWSSTADELTGVGATLTPLQRATIQWAVDGGDEDERPDPATVEPLAAALRDPDPCVRRMAALKLGRSGHPRAIAALTTALGGAEPELRAVGALGLGYAEDPRSIEPLGDALHDDTPEVRAAAAWALGEIEDARAIPLLIPVLRGDADPAVRRVAAWALGSIE